MLERRQRTVEQIRARKAMGVRLRRRPVPKQRQPDALRLEYFKAIRGWLEEARAYLERELFPMLPALIAEARAERADERMDAGGSRVNDIMDRVSSRFFAAMSPRATEQLAKRYGEATSEHQRRQLRGQIRAALGVDVIAAEPRLAPMISDFTAENVALIRSVPSRYFEDVEARVTSAMRTGIRHEELAKELRERFAVSESRAKLIARDQVGKFHGELNKTRQQAMGVTAYVWRTVNDGRVRDEHAEREGRSFQWSDPPEDGHPGQPINCRCNAEPDLSAILESLG